MDAASYPPTGPPAASCASPLPVLDLGVAHYSRVLELQRRLSSAIAATHLPGALLLLEHPPVITIGKRGTLSDIRDLPALTRRGVDIIHSDRGGQATLHAPGQLLSYPLIRLPKGGLRPFVYSLEEVLVLLLQAYHLSSHRLPGQPGVYIQGRKVASVGLRCQQRVVTHGTSLNVNTDLSLFRLLTSCGDPRMSHTSMATESGHAFSLRAIKEKYAALFGHVFGVDVCPLQAVRPEDVEPLLGLPPTPRDHQRGPS